ncbi:hypothetical protein [Bacteroides sp.]|uniref:hypothetical protein n=1 Tax=Bacteroides sp. TaxID=29523 RepID=UPI00261ABBE4|nr:hypothetical protein [Bacteroides sp.]MDD3041085.1 hypothetical protein [Bacteroides sp.]
MTSKTKLLDTIRQHCLNCCGGSLEDVENCLAGPDASPFSKCVLWEFRLGKDQKPNLRKTLELVNSTQLTAVAQDG